MPKHQWSTLALVLVLSAPALAAGPPRPLPDWPCDTPLAGPLVPDALWPGATAAPEDAWHDDPAARELVEFLTASENSPAMGEREIQAFAEKHGPVKPDTARLVVSGMVERGNVLRLVLLKGIKDQIIRSHVLAATIADDTAEIDAEEHRDSPAAKEHAAALREARRQNLSGLDSADDTADGLCRRLVYDETKLRRLAAALKAHTE